MELEVGAYIRYICVELGYNYITDIYICQMLGIDYYVQLTDQPVHIDNSFVFGFHQPHQDS